MKITIRSPRPDREVTQRWMRWSRRLLITAGLAALGYVGFTVVEARLYQASAKQSLETQIQTAPRLDANPIQLPVKMGDVLGRIDIPRLGVSVAVLEGTSARTLRLGVGHVAGTPLPGEIGNSGIAGHRDTFFRELKDIRNQDEIRLQTGAGLLRYQVDWARVVGPNDTSVLEPSGAGSTLTLVTCYPFYYVGPAPNRFVVHASKN